MKKQLLYLMLFAGSMVAFTGCSKDDGGDANAIEGTWKLKKSVSTTYVNGEVQNTSTDTYEDGEETLILKDGKFTYKENYEGETDEDNGTYVLSGSKLTVTTTGEEIDSDVLTVKSVSSNSLVLVHEEEDTNGDIKIKYVDEETYTK